MVLADNRPADRQSQSAAGTIAAGGITRVFFENTVEVLVGNGRTGVAYVYAVAVRRPHDRLATLRSGCHRGENRAAFPKVRVSADLDGTRFGSEFARVVEDVDEHLLDLAGVEVHL